MNIAKNTVPLLSNSWLTYRETLSAVRTKRQVPFSCVIIVNALMYLGVCAGVGELPNFASLVTKRTHNCVSLTNLFSTTQ